MPAIHRAIARRSCSPPNSDRHATSGAAGRDWIWLATLPLLVLATASPTAQAGGYVAIDGSSITLGDSFADDLNPLGGRLRFGLRVSDAFDFEVHAGLSSDEDNESFDEFRTSFAGAYLKGYAPIGERSALFALAGVAGVEYTQTIGDIEFSDDRGGFSYGVGLETELAERIDLSADWMRYLSGDESFEQVDAVSLGLKFYF